LILFLKGYLMNIWTFVKIGTNIICEDQTQTLYKYYG